jgi:hypothetical protein
MATRIMAVFCVPFRCCCRSPLWLESFGNIKSLVQIAQIARVRFGSDSESLAASKSSPLVLKQPTYAMIPQKDRVGPTGDISQLV